MKKLILAVLGVLILGAFALHWTSARQVDNRLNRLAAEIAPLGRLSWDNVRLSPTGEVQVNRVRFDPREGRDNLTIDQVLFRTGSLFSLLAANRELEAGRLPAGLGLTIRGLKVPVTREFDAFLSGSSPGLPFASAGCGEFDDFSFFDLTHLDIWELLVDFELDYRLVNQAEHLDLSSRLRLRQLGDLAYRLRLDLGENTSRLADLMPALQSSQVLVASQDYTDLGFYPRLMQFCARQNDMTVVEYIPRHVQAWVEDWLAQGLEPGPLVQAGYRHFLTEPQSVTVSFRPDPGLDVAGLGPSPGLGMLAQLNAEFSINDGIPIDLAVRSVQPITPARRVTNVDPVDDEVTSVPGGIVVGVIPEWQEIDPLAAGSRVGHRAIVDTLDGNRYSGRVVDVRDDQLHLSMQTRQGQFVRPVNLDRIERLQVRP